LKTVVLGKKIENKYEVIYNWKSIEDENGDVKNVFTDKPSIDKHSEVTEWVELCSYDGEPRYNSNDFLYTARNLNISDTETIYVVNEIFRADLNEMHLHTDKIVEEKDADKEEALSTCNNQIRAFNKMMIESNYKLKSYCDLHKLVYENTDCIELFNLVFPDEEYVIKDGVMKAKEKEQPQVYYTKTDTSLYDLSKAIAASNSITLK
jgi:hypothetical protein